MRAAFRLQSTTVNSSMTCFFFLCRCPLHSSFSRLSFITLSPPPVALIVVFLPRVDLFNLAVMTAEREEEESYDLKSASLDPQTGIGGGRDSG